MNTLYFKNSLTFENHCKSMNKKGYIVEYSSIYCSCGESSGAYILSDNEEKKEIETIEKCILCPHCYRRNGGK